MISFADTLEKLKSTSCATPEELAFLLGEEDPAKRQSLYDAAYAVKVRNCGREVVLRGLIECSNFCTRDCLYCGIRKSSRTMHRYTMSVEEICAAAKLAWEFGYGSVVLQAGERRDATFIEFIGKAVRRIKKESDGALGITLSLGEQSLETYRYWFSCGAHRYLLRIESSNPALYAKIQPPGDSHAERLVALQRIREAGYQLGTGVMIGLPHQTLEDLAGDLLFFRTLDVDMVGMGPYIVQHDTPLAAEFPDFEEKRSHQLEMGLKMIALLRLLMPDINIASTTALQSLAPDGRERGILAGANVIMPNVGDCACKSDYQLYDGKAGLDENAPESRRALEESLKRIGASIAYGKWGDSRRFAKRNAMP